MLKAVSGIYFIYDKTMSMYFRESIKKNNEKSEELSHSVFQTEQFEQIGFNYPNFVFSELIDVAKYWCVRVQ